jgi:ATP-binding cassette subfamily F protein 3
LPRRRAAGILRGSMLQLASISKRYGSQIVFDDVSWTVPDGARVGLTGPNGAGKSTLLKMIAGALEPDNGQVAVGRGTLIGYLPQHIIGIRGMSVLDHALAAFAELHELERRREAMEHDLATVDPQSDQYAAILERYSAICEEWEHRARYDIESETETVLHGLGFIDADMDRDCGELSGGWQMRVALAQLLLRRPDVLLLDEPMAGVSMEDVPGLVQLIADLNGQGVTVCMVEHHMHVVLGLADRIAVLHHGRMLAVGSPAEVMADDTVKRAYLGDAL